MAHVLMSVVPTSSSSTTSTRVELTQETRYVDTTYHYRSKSHKFYKYIFYFLLDVFITSTYILLCESGKCSSGLKKFCIALTKMLIGDYSSCRRPGRAGGISHSLPLRHFPLKQRDPGHENWHKRGRCEQCKSDALICGHYSVKLKEFILYVYLR